MNPALRLLLVLFTILSSTTIAGAAVLEAQVGVAFQKTYVLEGETGFSANFNAPKGGDKLKYHYTKADDANFENGLWRDTSVTDKLYDDAVQAGQELGIPTPTKVIPIKDKGQFVPNKPPVVQPSNRYQGGGTDFVNPEKVPASDLLPSQPVGGG